MTKKGKSLLLAKLMKWKLFKDIMIDDPKAPGYGQRLQPYLDTTAGLAQFAAILLAFPEVMTTTVTRIVHGEEEEICKWDLEAYKPTQANLLDEIVRMNGLLKE